MVVHFPFNAMFGYVLFGTTLLPVADANTQCRPPEVFDRDMGPTTEKVDIWALGCVMIAMSGGGPFPDDMSGPAIGHQLCNKRASPKLGPSHRFGKSVEQIVAQCLTIDAAGRPTANQLLQVCLWLGGGHANCA